MLITLIFHNFLFLDLCMNESIYLQIYIISAITYGDILTVLPFGNRVDSFELQGKYILHAMERSVTELNQIHTNLDHMLHISGTKIEKTKI